MRKIFAIFAGFWALMSQADACTAFQLKATDGSWIYCRSMEFGINMDSDFLIVPQGMDYTGTAPQGKPGLKWKAKYGFAGLNQRLEPTFVSDGMNEKGLVASILYLPVFAQYEAPNPAKTDRTLGMWELPAFILGTCSTIDEVKAVLPTILVAQEPVPVLGDFILPLHLYVSDAAGRVLIVEYVKGERKVYDDPIGVLTNSPPFDWQLINLSNYVTLSPFNAPALKLPNRTIPNIAQGSGLIGLPGDYTAASRFVKATFFSQFAQTPANGPEGVNLGFHILNTFDIFAGIIQTPNQKPHPQLGPEMDTTQWTVVHDRTNLKTYFRSYGSLKIQMVDLKKVDFTSGSYRTTPLAKDFIVDDVTNKMTPMTMRK